jgi:hypothetical protein
MAIHAAKGFPKWARETCNLLEFARELGSDPLPTGMVIATCRLISCVPTRELQQNRVIEVDYLAGCGDCGDFLLDDRERTFGDYSPGRWAWLLADIKPCRPIPAKGALSLWDFEGLTGTVNSDSPDSEKEKGGAK